MMKFGILMKVGTPIRGTQMPEMTYIFGISHEKVGAADFFCARLVEKSFKFTSECQRMLPKISKLLFRLPATHLLHWMMATFLVFSCSGKDDARSQLEKKTEAEPQDQEGEVAEKKSNTQVRIVEDPDIELTAVATDVAGHFLTVPAGVTEGSDPFICRSGLEIPIDIKIDGHQLAIFRRFKTESGNWLQVRSGDGLIPTDGKLNIELSDFDGGICQAGYVSELNKDLTKVTQIDRGPLFKTSAGEKYTQSLNLDKIGIVLSALVRLT